MPRIKQNFKVTQTIEDTPVFKENQLPPPTSNGSQYTSWNSEELSPLSKPSINDFFEASISVDNQIKIEDETNPSNGGQTDDELKIFSNSQHYSTLVDSDNLIVNSAAVESKKLRSRVYLSSSLNTHSKVKQKRTNVSNL